MKTKLWLSVLLVIVFLFAFALPAAAIELPDLTVQSDSLTEWSSDGITYSPSFECFEHSLWLDTGIDDVQWIWRTAVTNPNLEYTTVPEGGWYFKRTFELPSNAENITATLTSNCDNAYIVYINGTQILAQGAMNIEGPDNRDYLTLETNAITNLVPGTNTILIRAMNYFSSAAGSKIGQSMYGDGNSNPAGLIYKLDVNFDEAQFYNICGFKLDADTGEGIEDWEIILKDSEGTQIASGTTDANGKYCFSGLSAGTYTVEEVLQEGWEAVNPANGSHVVTLPNNSTIYGIQRSTGKIFEVDPLAPNSATLYKQIVAAETNKSFSATSPNGIGYDQETGDIYFATYPSPSRLYKFEGDVQRDLGSLIGSVASGEFYNGKYYYIADQTDDLYVVTFKEDGTIDAITPHINISSGVSAWYFGDIVVDHTEGVIYGEGQNLNSNKQEFFKVNLDGSGYVRIDADVFTNLLQLAIGTDNVLYAHSAYFGTFYTINRLTGDVVQVSDGENLYTDISSASTFYNFENRNVIEVTAKKFMDINENTLKDVEEDYAAGFEFTATKGSEERTATSDINGVIDFGMFDADDAGSWVVAEKPKLLYHQTNYLDGVTFTIANTDNVLSVNWTDNTDHSDVSNNIVEFGNALDKYNPGAAGTAWGGWQTSADFLKYKKGDDPIHYNGVWRTGSSAWAMAMEYNDGGADLTIPLIAGQYTTVGYVTIHKLSDTQITVTYTVSPVYKLVEQHCGMYNNLGDIPNNNGNLNGTLVDGVYTFDYDSGTVYIAAHCVVE